MDRNYVEQALSVFQVNIAMATIKELTGELARFQIASPDCNATAMSETLKAFLQDVAIADGHRTDIAGVASSILATPTMIRPASAPRWRAFSRFSAAICDGRCDERRTFLPRPLVEPARVGLQQERCHERA